MAFYLGSLTRGFFDAYDKAGKIVEDIQTRNLYDERMKDLAGGGDYGGGGDSTKATPISTSSSPSTGAATPYTSGEGRGAGTPYTDTPVKPTTATPVLLRPGETALPLPGQRLPMQQPKVDFGKVGNQRLGAPAAASAAGPLTSWLQQQFPSLATGQQPAFMQPPDLSGIPASQGSRPWFVDALGGASPTSEAIATGANPWPGASGTYRGGPGYSPPRPGLTPILDAAGRVISWGGAAAGGGRSAQQPAVVVPIPPRPPATATIGGYPVPQGVVPPAWPEYPPPQPPAIPTLPPPAAGQALPNVTPGMMF